MSRPLTLPFAFVVGAVLLLAGCGGERAARAAPTTHVVEIRAMAFHPSELHVAAGDTIVWVNRDVLAHTATDSASGWSSPALEMGARWRTIAPEGDTVRYTCAFHPVMEGRIIVDGRR